MNATGHGTTRGRMNGWCAAARMALAALVASIPLAAAGAQDTTAARVATPDSTPVIVTGPVRVVDLGPGLSGRMLRTVLAGRRTVVRGAPGRTVVVPRDTGVLETLVVLGGDAAIAGRVNGDVVVVGGDLFLRPGARIEGRAMAYGGGVYGSSLAFVRGERYAWRDHTFDATEVGGEVQLRYRDLEQFPVPLVGWPAYGLQLPEYNRVDGLALGVGPTITVAEGGAEFVPVVTYRSHLGAVDPAVAARVRLGRRLQLEGEVGRATFSNDRWIRGNLQNSITSFLGGVDMRNYFRADRAELRVSRRWESAEATVTPFVGARVERAWSTGPDSTATSTPFSILNRDDEDRDRMLRFNPRVTRGNTSSALAGARLEWESAQRLTLTTVLLVEQALDSPVGGFTQVTGDLDLGFPTFGTQSFNLSAHAVGTASDAPPQRWAYLGGNGTILTLDRLQLGGDQLAYVESRYTIPIERLSIPFAGPPRLALRHMIGSAGVGRLPGFVQNVGARLTVAVLRFDYTIDPATRESNADVSFTVPF